MANNKLEFLSLYSGLIRREGAKELLSYLDNNTDFFSAPASTRYHLSEESGLVKHSINVYMRLKELTNDYSIESVAICGLLHDLCKTNYYKSDFRNVKNEKGIWERVPYYAVDDEFPYGHGEKSVYLIERFMKLTPGEAMAIRWHMGGFGNEISTVSQAFSKYPLAMLLHVADLQATYLDEVRTDDKV